MTVFPGPLGVSAGIPIPSVSAVNGVVTRPSSCPGSGTTSNISVTLSGDLPPGYKTQYRDGYDTSPSPTLGSWTDTGETGASQSFAGSSPVENYTTESSGTFGPVTLYYDVEVRVIDDGETSTESTGSDSDSYANTYICI